MPWPRPIPVPSVLHVFVAVLCLVLNSAVTAQNEPHIVTWGTNTPQWNSLLGVNAVRLGCSGAPAGCVRAAERLARSQKVDNVFLAIRLDVTKAASYAREYSKLSLTNPVLYEVGFDDFVGQSQREKLSPRLSATVLSEIARAVKSENPTLPFGITLYMDELDSTRFRLSELPAHFRASIDFVHLYPHYRKEASSFEDSLRLAQTLFPRARVIAGLYAYDRRNYLPCARNGKPCSTEEEMRLFTQSIENRWALLRSRDINGIEFYPGNFGLEEQWTGWKNPRSCRAGRTQECIDNTKQMRDILGRFLKR